MSGAPADGGSTGEEPPGDAGTTDEGGVSWVLAGLALAALWLFVRGVALAPVRIAEEGLIGLAVGLPVAYAARRFYVPMTGLDRSPRVVPYAALYVLAFAYELVTANVDVARRVLAPSMPIYPDVVEVRLRVRSDLAITTIANSITLTPGTLTMDYDGDTNTLYVHCIDGRDPDAVREPIRRWEDYALVVFDEELKPGDPVPAVDGRATEGAGDGTVRGDAVDGEVADGG